MDEGFNYYEILDLDPSIDDWPTIEAAIEQKRRVWYTAQQNAVPKIRRPAEKYASLLPNIREVLKHPTQRRAHAEAWAKKRSTIDQKKYERLDELADVLGARRTLSTEDVTALVTQLKDVGISLTEADVERHLRGKGFSLELPRSRAGDAVKPQVEQPVLDEMQAILQVLGLSSLYSFLDLDRRSSLNALQERSDRLYKEFVGKPPTVENSARKDLAGLGQMFFRDEAEKAKFDNSLSLEAMKRLRPEIEFAGRDRVLTATEFDLLIRKSREAGVPQEDATVFIEEYAHKRKWVLQTAEEISSVDLKQCGFCESLAPTPQHTRCPNCGQDLVQPCPRCGEPTATQDASCAKCGCHTGDGPTVKALLKEAERCIVEGDLNEAVACCDRALLLWEGWSPAVEIRNRAQSRQTERTKALTALETLLAARRLDESSRTLERFLHDWGPAQTESIRTRIDEGLKRARTTLGSAEALRRTGKIDQAIELCEEALTHCADLRPALDILAQNPPPPPDGVRAEVSERTIRLKWSHTRASGTLRFSVVRKAGGTPSNVGDGTVVAETGAAHFDDVGIQTGIPWFYAVFSRRSGIPSTVAAVSGPHLLVAEVGHLEVLGGNGQVSLRWSPPDGSVGVEVWRREGASPVRPGEGQRVTISGDTAVDVGLTNGNVYGYLVVTLFPDASRPGHRVPTPGRQITCTPIVLPAAVTDLEARRDEETVLLKWTPPPLPADVQIRQTKAMPEYSPGRAVPVVAANRFGDPVPVSGRGSAQVVIEGRGRFFFVPLSVVADTAVLGTPVAVTLMDEVTALTARRNGQNIILMWNWPKDARDAQVAYSYDAFPEDAVEGNATRLNVARAEYERTGCWELRNATRQRHYFSVFVKDPDGDFFSSGAHVLESMGQTTTVSYSVVVKKGLLKRGIREAWVELRCDGVQSLRGIRIIGKQRNPPTSASDGVLLGEVPSLSFEQGLARIDVARHHYDSSYYVKLFFEDPGVAQEVRLLPSAKDQLLLG